MFSGRSKPCKEQESFVLWPRNSTILSPSYTQISTLQLPLLSMNHTKILFVKRKSIDLDHVSLICICLLHIYNVVGTLRGEKDNSSKLRLGVFSLLSIWLENNPWAFRDALARQTDRQGIEEFTRLGTERTVEPTLFSSAWRWLRSLQFALFQRKNI